MRDRIRRWSIATRLLVLQVVFVTVLTTIVVALLWADSSAAVDRDAASKSMDIATSVADNPFVLEALTTADPSLTLEPYVLKVMSGTSTDFITIMALDRTRYTHPNPEQIGKPFEGTIAPALHGVSFTETYRGTLGRSVRAVVPIRNAEGKIIALVSAGVEVSNVTLALWSRLPIVFAAAAATLLLGALASWSLSRYLRRVTWGRGPEEMSRMFSYHEGMLHSVREGLLLVDRQGRLVLYNDQAAELLALPPQQPGGPALPVADLDIPEDLRELLGSGECAVDEICVTDDRRQPANRRNGRTGADLPHHRHRRQPARPHRGAAAVRRAADDADVIGRPALADPRVRESNAHDRVAHRIGPPAGGPALCGHRDPRRATACRPARRLDR
jgi:two-component system CitB family sensor kinase